MDCLYDTIEILEQSQTGELAGFENLEPVKLDFLHKMLPVPAIKRLNQHYCQLSLNKPAQQLNTLFETYTLESEGVDRQNDLLLDEQYTTIMQGVAWVGGQKVDIKVDVSSVMTEPEILNLTLGVFGSDFPLNELTAEITWGDYNQTAESNNLGLFKFSLPCESQPNSERFRHHHRRH